MDNEPRALDNPINWSFTIGRLFGIRIRIHLLFLIGAVILLGEGLRNSTSLSGLLQGMGLLGILFLIVLLHEFGHCFGARRVGGDAEEILLWPLGGLASVHTPHNPQAHLITAIAGPAVNVVICLVVGLILFISAGGVGAIPLNPFKPFAPSSPITSQFQWWMVSVFGISYVLLMFNLAPVFPLDGGRVLQSVLWKYKGYRDATMTATFVGMVGAIGFGLLAFISQSMLLVGIAFFGYVTCLQQRQLLKMGAYEQENEFGYDFSQGYASLDRTDEQPRKLGYFARRRAERAARLEQREKQRLEQDQQRLDGLLAKIGKHGSDSLTPDERRFLERETERRRTGRG